MPLFTAPTQGFATRGFSKEVNTPESPLYSNPEDYELFEMGEFIPETGIIVPHKAPISVCTAKSVAKS